MFRNQSGHYTSRVPKSSPELRKRFVKTRKNTVVRWQKWPKGRERKPQSRFPVIGINQKSEKRDLVRKNEPMDYAQSFTRRDVIWLSHVRRSKR